MRAVAAAAATPPPPLAAAHAPRPARPAARPTSAAQQPQLERAFTHAAHKGVVKCAAAAGPYAATGGADDLVHLYDLKVHLPSLAAFACLCARATISRLRVRCSSAVLRLAGQPPLAARQAAAARRGRLGAPCRPAARRSSRPRRSASLPLPATNDRPGRRTTRTWAF